MKKIFILVMICLLVSGCGKNTESSVTNEITKNFNGSKGYKLSGSLEINNNDDVYNYNVSVGYNKKNNSYKVELINQANDFKQIILKNQDGVYLYTPSLNKSFKFNSDWPNDNSQIYLLDAVINDIKHDNEKSFVYKNNKYIYTTKVNYPNNSKLSKQKVIFDKDKKLRMVTVYNSDDSVCMRFTIDKIKMSPSFSKSYFKLNNSKTESSNEKDNKKTKETMSIDDVVYPLFLPSGTKLVDEKKIDKDAGQRVIMTYDGEKSFLLVEETLEVFNDYTTIPSTGEPFQLMDTIGVMTDNSLSWISGNIEYYLVSEVMSKDELVEVAQSIVGITSIK